MISRNIFFLIVYLMLSIGLVFYQRWAMQKYPYPVSVSSLHFILIFVLATIAKFSRTSSNNEFKSIRSTLRNLFGLLAPIGIASSLDILLSNCGLKMVTVTLYTLTKSTSIIFILIFAIVLKLERKSLRLLITIVCIATGLSLYTYKSTQFNRTGFSLLLLASLCSGLRWTLTQKLVQSAQYVSCHSPIDFMVVIEPFMIVTTVSLAVCIDGLGLLHALFYHNRNCYHFQCLSIDFVGILTVLCGGLLAFLMTITEFLLVKHTSSLTLSIAGVFKEILTIMLAIEFQNDDRLTPMNSLGLFLCLIAICSHVYEKMTVRGRRGGGMHKTAAATVENVLEPSSSQSSQSSSTTSLLIGHHSDLETG